MKEKEFKFLFITLGFWIGGGGGGNEHNCMYLPNTLPKIDDCFHDFVHNGHMENPKPKPTTNLQIHWTQYEQCIVPCKGSKKRCTRPYTTQSNALYHVRGLKGGAQGLIQHNQNLGTLLPLPTHLSPSHTNCNLC